MAKVIILGKTEAQDTYVVFTGKGVMLSRSVRRIATEWKSHLGFYVHFNAPAWCFKTGFGSRLIPTRRTLEALPAFSDAPAGPVLPSALHDPDGEAVRKKAQEEQREESEMQSMAKMDFPAGPHTQVSQHRLPQRHQQKLQLLVRQRMQELLTRRWSLI